MTRLNRDELERPFSGREDWIADTLAQLDFVQWDRWYELGSHRIAVFGWIAREEDEYKDFVLLVIDVDRTQVVGYHTSSAEYTETIAETVEMAHSACKRVEDYLDVPNTVMLKDDRPSRDETEGDTR